MEAIDAARSAAEIAAEHQATEIVLLDIRDVTPFVDFFVICNGTSERQMQAIGESIETGLRDFGDRKPRREGTARSGWYLLDYGPLIVHIFSPEKRDYYRLEKLWERGRPLLTLQ